MRLDSLQPAGTFVPRSWTDDFLLVAAGSGITPVMSILRTALAEHDNTITLLYANRDPASMIFADQLDVLTSTYGDRLSVAHWLESESGLPTAEGLRRHLDNLSGKRAFLCGPAAFMDVVTTALTDGGMSRDMIHKEVFVSLSVDAFESGISAAPTEPAEDDAIVTVDIDGAQHTVCWPRAQVLLDVLLDNGIDAPFVCREGNCGGCAYTLRTGDVDMRVNDTLDQYELDNGVRLACQSIPQTDRLDIVFDR